MSHLSQAGTMPKAFSPVWADELDITKFLSRAQPLAMLAPMLTRGLKHARDTPDDNGVASDAGGNKTQLRARRMQEEPVRASAFRP